MRYTARIPAASLLLPAALLLGGCVERATPTSPVLEQAVFTLLGGLRPGEDMVLRGAEAHEAIVAGPRVRGEFLYVPFHASRTSGAELAIRVQGENVASPSGAGLSTAVAPNPFSPHLERAWAPSRHEQLLGEMRERARPYLGRLAAAPTPAADPRAPRADLSGDNAHVGQLVQINTSTVSPICTARDLRTGRVEAIGQRSIIVGDIANPAGGFNRTDYESFASEIDQLIYPTVIRYFSDPTDIDNNNRVIVFFTRAVNELTLPGEQGFVAGFFYVRDIFPRSLCPASNEAEIFYILVPDPQGEASSRRHSRESVYRGALNTVGHELQHLINASRRAYLLDAEELEEVWLDEGLSHAAEELLFYAQTGLQPKSNLGAEILGSQPVVNAINRFLIQNLSRYDLYLANVTRRSPTAPQDLLETRGAAWSFLRYAADHSPRSDEDFFRGLVNSGLSGLANMDAILADDALDWLRRWGVSIFTDDLVLTGDDRLQQPSWNFRALMPPVFGTYRLPVLSLTPGQPRELQLLAGTSGYVRFGGQSGSTTRVVTTSGGSAPPPALHVTVVRIE